MTDEEIVEITGKPVHSCSCTKCKDMCTKTPCLGTPENILKLIEAGYKNMLMQITWAAGYQHGIPYIDMVVPRTKSGTMECIFHENGKCKLHDSGLKPIEGKIASCTSVHTDANTYPPFVIAKTWADGSILPKQLKRVVTNVK
jgi:hypothetical protein